MAAYAIVLLTDLRDPDQLDRYREAVAPVVERHGGRYLAADFAPTAVEGPQPIAAVLLEFPDAERLRGLYDAEEYAPLKAERQQAGDFTFLLVNGL